MLNVQKRGTRKLMDWAKEYYCDNIDPIINEPEAEQMDDM